MKKREVYLDYAATTPVDPKVVKAMEPYWGKFIGNTMSLHSQGQKASAAVEKAREIIAKFIGAETEEIVFTGSATESNNLALKGVAEANPLKKKILISSVEHDCVVESAKWLAGKGYEIKEIPVNREGLIGFEWFLGELSEEILLVSVIHGNNEVGTIQDIGRIGNVCREKGVLFHTDASQSFGKVPIDVKEMKIDLLTVSSHKIYGPKGAAVLFVRNGVAIKPILHGGGHEGGLRSSTVNVPAIVGMGKAVEIAEKSKTENLKIRKLRDKLIKGILESVEDCWLNGDINNRLSNNVNISFARVEGEGLLLELDRRGISSSTGSACSSRSLEPSHVLLAMGLTAPEAHGSIRFSLGRRTTEAEINYVLKVVPEVVKKLRKISPFKK
ncbi:MAG: IscS subfamily cysteine desulfurase [Patescibacteria group bacterium]